MFYFSYFSTKTYVVGTQKNRLNETVLLSIKTYVKTDGNENIYIFTLKNFKPVHFISLLMQDTVRWKTCFEWYII